MAEFPPAADKVDLVAEGDHAGLKPYGVCLRFEIEKGWQVVRWFNKQCTAETWTA
jgi:hypothetical protein